MMARKMLALLLCAALLGTAPGVSSLFALSGSHGSGQRTFMVEGREVTIPSYFSLDSYYPLALPGLQTIPADLQGLEKRLKTINTSPGMREKALALYTRLEPYLADPNRRPAEVQAAISQFNRRYQDGNFNREIALTELFDGLTRYAVDMQNAGNYRTEVGDENDRMIRVTNGMQNYISQEVYVHKVNSRLQRLEVYRPVDGRQELEQLGFAYTIHGVQKQKIIWSRSLISAAERVKRQFYDMPDLQAKINDKTTPEAEKKTLRAVRGASQAKYNRAGMHSLLQEMKSAGPGRMMGRELSPEEVERLSRAIEDQQRRLQAFAAGGQLEQIQKVQLAQLIQYLSQTLGLNYDPFKGKDGAGGQAGFAGMDFEEVQKLLNDLDRGAYGGYGLVGGLLGRWKYRRVDPDRDMPPALRVAAAEAVRYLNNAVNAYRRVKEAGRRGRREEQAAFVEELTRWMQLAQVELQRFDFLSNRVNLEYLMNGKSPQEIRLRAEDRGEAERLIDVAARQFGPKFDELSERTQRKALEDAAGSFALTLENARYTNMYSHEMKDSLAAMGAKLRELRAIYLAGEFHRFVQNPSNLAAFRNSRKNQDSYYGDKVQGKLYDFFLRRLTGEARRAVAGLDALIADLGSIRADDPDQARRKLGPIEDRLKELLSLWGYAYAPDPEETQKDAQRLAVFQSNLFSAVERFQSEMQLFSGLNTFDLILEKYTTSTNLPETRSRNALARFFELRWMDPWINKATFGGRDALQKGAVWAWDRKAYEMLGSPKQVARRVKIRGFLRRGDYEGALREMAKIDPEGSKKALDRYHQSRALDLDLVGEDIENVLTRNISTSREAAAQGALEGAYKALPGYIRASMVGALAVDWAVMSAATLGIGLVVGGATKGLATGGARMTRAMEAMRTTNFLTRMTIRSVEFGSRAFDSIYKNIRAGMAFPKEAMAFVNRPWGTLWDMWKISAKTTGRTGAIVGVASGGIQAGYYAISPKTASSKNMKEAVLDGFIGGAGWGVKGGWMFMMMPSASVWQGKNPVSSTFRALGNVGGPVDMVGRGVLRLKPFNRTAMGRMIAKNAEADGFLGANGGMWGAAAQRVEAMLSPWKRVPLNMATKTAMFVDGAAKYAVMSEAMMEGTQAASYGWRKRRLGDIAEKAPIVGRFFHPEPLEQGEFAPSEHMQNLVGAHHDALGFAQAAFLLIPNAGFYSPADIRRFKETSAGITALHQNGGKLLNDFFKTPITESGTFRVPIRWYHSPWRRLWGMKQAEVPVTSETKSRVAEMTLRSRGLKLPELFAIEMLPDKVKGADGQERANHQQFWSIDELRRVAQGEEVIPAAKAQTEMGRSDLVYLVPEIKDVASRLISEKISRSPNVASMIRDAREGRPLTLDGATVSNPNIIKKFQERMTWIAYDRNAEKVRGPVMRVLRNVAQSVGFDLFAPKDVRGQVMEALRKNEREKGFNPENFKQTFSDVWEDIIRRESTRGEEGKNLAWAMEKARDPMMGDLLLQYNMDYLNRQVGKVRGDKVFEIRDRVVGAINQVLSFGGVIDARTGAKITALRSPKIDPKHPAQREAVEAFVTAVLDGQNPVRAYADTIRLYTFLEASGGKTLLIKTAFIPLLKVRAEKTGRKVWFLTTNEHLARQFHEDWASYSGGRRPDFKVSSVDEAIFQEVFGIERGEPSIGEKHHFVFDEGDEPFRKPSHSIGEKTGQITAGNPLIEVHLKGLEKMQAEVGPLQAKVRTGELSPEGMKAEVQKKIPGMARDLAVEWQKAYRSVGWKSPFREESQIAKKTVQESHGGPEKFLEAELENHYKALTLEDPSRHYRIDDKTYEVTPVHYGSEMPTLSTEYRATAQLLALQQIRREGKTPETPLKLDLPLTHTRILKLNEFFQRLKKGGADILMTSGTASQPVSEFLGRKIGMGFVNIEGKTLRPEPEFMMSDFSAAAGGRSQAMDMAAQLTRDAIVETEPGKKPLALLLPRSLGELKALEKALLDAGVVKKSEIARFYPDYVHQMNKEYKLGLTIEENNTQAVESGAAKVVLLVPDVGGRGTDLPFKQYKGRITMIGLDTHEVPVIEDTQAKARIGPGRVAERDRVKFIDIVSSDRLLRPSVENIYPSELSKLIAQAKIDQVPADGATANAVREIKRLAAAQNDSQFMDKITDPSSPEFRGFAVKPEVYKAMHPVLQEIVQRKANASSGILDH